MRTNLSKAIVVNLRRKAWFSVGPSRKDPIPMANTKLYNRETVLIDSVNSYY